MVPRLLSPIVQSGVTPELSLVDAKHVQITNIMALCGAFTLLVWSAMSAQGGFRLNAAENLFAAVAFSGVPLLNRWRLPTLAATCCAFITHLHLLWALYFFGFPSSTPLFYGLCIVVPYLLLPRRRRPLAHGLALLSAAAWVAVTAGRDAFPLRLAMVDESVFQVVNTSFVALTLVAAAAGFTFLVDRTEDALDAARERADALLLNVLPPSIAARLKADPNGVIADRHEAVTILFADLVGFTELSGRTSAARTVELLNDVFTEFDAICDDLGVEKIKTIGDGYMAISGAPQPREDHARRMARAAVRMRDFMAGDPTGHGLQVRIGLNSGSAVGAIVGRSRFHYDVWSDAVNVAARMESHSQPGRIQITETTWALIAEEFPCEARGAIPVKGKGTMQTWFIL